MLQPVSKTSLCGDDAALTMQRTREAIDAIDQDPIDTVLALGQRRCAASTGEKGNGLPTLGRLDCVWFVVHLRRHRSKFLQRADAIEKTIFGDLWATLIQNEVALPGWRPCRKFPKWSTTAMAAVRPVRL